MSLVNLDNLRLLTQLKIGKNKKIVELLETEGRIYMLDMVLVYRLLKQNDIMIKKVKDVNKIEERQLYTYSIYREKDLIKLAEEIKNYSIDVSDLSNDKKLLASAREDITKKLMEIEAAIVNVSKSPESLIDQMQNIHIIC
jgi:hypothetical protein